MSRPIKFRAWDKGQGCWIKPFDGVDPWSGRVFYVEFGGTFEFYDPRVVSLMQYTGLKDKNGVEIYEGDIVKILYTDWPSQLDSHPELSHEQYLDMLAETKVVIWKVQGFYVSTRVDGYAESMEPGTHGYIEVIGNIYETPELLEAKS